MRAARQYHTLLQRDPEKIILISVVNPYPDPVDPQLIGLLDPDTVPAPYNLSKIPKLSIFF
jgi:hypothetical protein